MTHAPSQSKIHLRTNLGCNNYILHCKHMKYIKYTHKLHNISQHTCLLQLACHWASTLVVQHMFFQLKLFALLLGLHSPWLLFCGCQVFLHGKSVSTNGRFRRSFLHGKISHTFLLSTADQSPHWSNLASGGVLRRFMACRFSPGWVSRSSV